MSLSKLYNPSNGSGDMWNWIVRGLIILAATCNYEYTIILLITILLAGQYYLIDIMHNWYNDAFTEWNYSTGIIADWRNCITYIWIIVLIIDQVGFSTAGPLYLEVTVIQLLISTLDLMIVNLQIHLTSWHDTNDNSRFSINNSNAILRTWNSCRVYVRYQYHLHITCILQIPQRHRLPG